MIQTAIARRYAKALFSLLNPSDIRSAAESLSALGGGLNVSRELRDLLQNPVIGLDKKAAVVQQLGTKAKAPPVVEQFLAHVVRKNRITLLAEIAEAFARLADQSSNRKVVHLSSARSLTDANRAEIQQKLEGATRGTIELTTDVDARLLGGLQIRIGSTVYDGTIRGQIDRMRTALSKET